MRARVGDGLRHGNRSFDHITNKIQIANGTTANRKGIDSISRIGTEPFSSWRCGRAMRRSKRHLIT
jgi:hypothetical protein